MGRQHGLSCLNARHSGAVGIYTQRIAPGLRGD